MTQFLIPDIGSDGASVASILVKVGDSIEKDQPLLELESDKASMEVPSEVVGVVKEILLKEGEKVQTGTPMFDIEEQNTNASQKESVPKNTLEKKDEESQPASSGTEILLTIPDIGSDGASVASILVKVGDSIEKDQPLLELESDKASMEVPSEVVGVVKEILLKEGEKVQTGTPALKITSLSSQGEAKKQPQKEITASESKSIENKQSTSLSQNSKTTYSSPASRKLAREMNIDITLVPSSQSSGRISLDDVKNFQGKSAPTHIGGSSIPEVLLPNFESFGKVEKISMSKIHKITAEHMSKAWLNVPHVTQFDDANILDIEKFRASLKKEADKKSIKLTLLPFVVMSCAKALEMMPQFNVSLDMPKGEIIQKHYINVGIAVDTPKGLLVPVIKEVNQKNIWQLAQEITALGSAALKGKLTAKDLQGGCFSISSLGGIGGTHFTPIVNTPEVAILGIGRSKLVPAFDEKMNVKAINQLPLALSYDHRAVNGADSARFLMLIKGFLEDFRRLAIS